MFAYTMRGPFVWADDTGSASRIRKFGKASKRPPTSYCTHTMHEMEHQRNSLWLRPFPTDGGRRGVSSRSENVDQGDRRAQPPGILHLEETISLLQSEVHCLQH